MSFFPQTNTKSNGNAVSQANRECGNFKGIIKDIREIKSTNNPSVFAVIDIEVEGKPGVFQDYLNFNPQKAEQSMGFLVAHCKSAILSTGAPISNPDEEKDMNWVETSYTKLKDSKSVLHFQQSADANGRLNINYIPVSQQPVGF